MGLAFVAWTRVTTFDRLAFRHLPPLHAFYAVRQSGDFKERERFEIQAADQHKDHLMRTKQMSLEDELQQHVEHSAKVLAGLGRSRQCY